MDVERQCKENPWLLQKIVNEKYFSHEDYMKMRKPRAVVERGVLSRPLPTEAQKADAAQRLIWARSKLFYNDEFLDNVNGPVRFFSYPDDPVFTPEGKGKCAGKSSYWILLLI